MRVVGSVAPFTTLGSVPGENSFYRGPRLGNGHSNLCRVPLAVVRHASARQTSGTRPCVDCRRVLWVPGPQGQYSGEIRFIEKPATQDEGVAMLLKVFLTSGKCTTMSNFRDGTLC